MSKQTHISHPRYSFLSADGSDQVIFPTVEAAVSTAAQAQTVFQDHSLELRRAVIQTMRKDLHRQRGALLPCGLFQDRIMWRSYLFKV